MTRRAVLRLALQDPAVLDALAEAVVRIEEESPAWDRTGEMGCIECGQVRVSRQGQGPKRTRDQLVYFIRNEATGEIKIGVSYDPWLRLNTLQVACTGKLTLVGVAAGGEERERKFHEDLMPYRVSGEWFAPDPKVLALVKRHRGTKERFDARIRRAQRRSDA